ncbi:unnamed protein product [Fusarium venenatum]|uniref:Uncharacterized protein n=1 Tax=Fusarium venenatum TaxID=56646 RepID=A0A2L2SSW5_9HYPO|nr:uncharacterized protein FVRRES_13231 [Fusarium venenatum]CEI40692.1 unnamed protein product [Fusarium venenatum]
MVVSAPIVGSIPLHADLSFTEGMPSVTGPEHHVKVPAHRSGASAGSSMTTASQASLPTIRKKKKKKKKKKSSKV